MSQYKTVSTLNRMPLPNESYLAMNNQEVRIVGVATRIEDTQQVVTFKINDYFFCLDLVNFNAVLGNQEGHQFYRFRKIKPKSAPEFPSATPKHLRR